MTRIPAKLRKQLAQDPFYQRCCITGKSALPGDRIEWHHNLIFAGKQVQARFAILPVLKSMHELAHMRAIKDRLDWVMASRMSGEDLELYGKGRDWIHRLEYLESLFGKFVPWYEKSISY